VAAAKVPRLLDAGAHVVVVAPEVRDDITRLPVQVVRRRFAASDLDGCWYVVSAAPRAVNAGVAQEAARRHVFVNAVDDPRHATAFAGSGFTRGPVTVALSTGGEAPALARVLREALERLIGRGVEDWTSLAARLREDWRRDRVPMDQRRDRLLDALADLQRSVRATAPARVGSAGLVSIVGAGPGDPELLTRRAMRRLTEADLVLYDALVSPAVVSIATRAQQIFVGRRRGSATVGQEAITRTLIRAARRGKHVVRLKGGDPFVFGRGGEEALALKAANVPFEIIPGVSAAFAAPAAASIPVTHRGISGTVLVTSGHDIERFAALVGSVPAGEVTVVVMMGTARSAEISRALAAAGWHDTTPAAIVWDASLPAQSVWSGSLGALAAVAAREAPGTIVVGHVVSVGEWLTRHEPLMSQEVCHG
jgi:uroporphyrin-III C-methyltransferase/precorrin-2 dehydrogenase/sirohydrochlorin ferrochelatase